MLEYDANDRATNVATNATLDALIETLVEKGVLSRPDAFKVFSDARKGLSAAAADQLEIRVAREKLTEWGSGFAVTD